MTHMERARKAKKEAAEWSAIGHHEKARACLKVVHQEIWLLHMARRINRRMGYCSR